MSIALLRAAAAAGSGHVSPPQFTETGLVLDWHVTPDRITTVDDSGTPRISALADSGPNEVDLSQDTMGQRPEYLATGVGGQPGARSTTGRGDVLTGTGPGTSAGPITAYVWLVVDSLSGGARYAMDCQTGRLGLVPSDTTVDEGLRAVDGVVRVFGAAVTGPQALTYVLVGGTDTAAAYRNGALVGTADWVERGLSGSISMCGINTGATTSSPNITVGRIRVYTGAHDEATRAANLLAGHAIYGFGAP